MTLSDAFGVAPVVAAEPVRPVRRPDVAQVHARMRARDVSVPRVTARLKTVGADVGSAWWLPASLPTLSAAWADRVPDRSRVPGDNAVLYRGWVGYNHTVGLAAPAVALAVVGVLAPLVWIARHPARLLLTAAIVAAFLLLTLT